MSNAIEPENKHRDDPRPGDNPTTVSQGPTETIAAKMRAAEQRYEVRLKELGISQYGDCISEEDPRRQRFDDAWQSYRKEQQEILSLLPASPELPPGWEGNPPDSPLTTISDLTSFVAGELRRVQKWGRSRQFGTLFVELAAEALLNAHRWLLHASLLVQPFPERPRNADEAERRLVELLVWLKSHGHENAEVSPSSELVQQTSRSESMDGQPDGKQSGNKLAQASSGASITASRRTGIPWQEAAERLARLRQQGEPYTSMAKFAQQIGCSSSTIKKAFANVPELGAWKKTKIPKTAPAATQLSDPVIGYIAQTREPVPGSLPTPDEADLILERLIAQAPEADREEMRQTLKSLPPEERARVAAPYQGADDLDDRIRHHRV